MPTLDAIIAAAGDSGEALVVGGGEPTLRKDLPELVEEEVRHEDRVDQVVLPGGASVVADLAEVEGAFHPKLAPKASQTRSPLFRPSS